MSKFYFVCNFGIVFMLTYLLLVSLLHSTELLLNPWNSIMNLFHGQFKNETKTLVGVNTQSHGYMTFMFSIFMFVLLLNIIGLFPYVFSPTVHMAITMGFSFTIVMGTFLYSIMNFKGEFLAIFTPLGAPLALSPALVLIETVSFLAKMMSLGVRLAANITAGHLLLAIMSSFGMKMCMSGCMTLAWCSTFATLMLIFVILLEMAVAFIQAYVFCLLTTMYISEGYHLH